MNRDFSTIVIRNTLSSTFVLVSNGAHAKPSTDSELTVTVNDDAPKSYTSRKRRYLMGHFGYCISIALGCGLAFMANQSRDR